MLKNQQKEIDLIENIDITKIEAKKRSNLHVINIVKWFRKHQPLSTKKKYLYYPLELKRNIEINKLFQIIDVDGSSKTLTMPNQLLQILESLDLNELENMFNHYNFQITKADLQQLFEIVDFDNDRALNMEEFKICALNERANQGIFQIINFFKKSILIVFTNIMRRIRKNNDQKEDSQKNIYIPMTFQAMMSHLCYNVLRNDIKEKFDLAGQKNSIINQILKLQELFRLNQLYQPNIKRKADSLTEQFSSSFSQQQRIQKIQNHQQNQMELFKSFLSPKHQLLRQNTPQSIDYKTPKDKKALFNLLTLQKFQKTEQYFSQFKQQHEFSKNEAKMELKQQANQIVQQSMCNLDAKQQQNSPFFNAESLIGSITTSRFKKKMKNQFAQQCNTNAQQQQKQPYINVDIGGKITTKFIAKKNQVQSKNVVETILFSKNKNHNLKEINNILKENLTKNYKQYSTLEKPKQKKILQIHEKKIQEYNKQIEQLSKIAKEKFNIQLPSYEKKNICQLNFGQEDKKNILSINNQKFGIYSQQDKQKNSNSNRISQNQIINNETNQNIPKYLLEQIKHRSFQFIS